MLILAILLYRKITATTSTIVFVKLSAENRIVSANSHVIILLLCTINSSMFSDGIYY